MRAPREVSETGIYHIVQRGSGRQMIFEDDDDRRQLYIRMDASRSRFRIEYLAWCFMDNHFHLVVFDAAGQLSRFMQHLGGGYAQYFNQRHSRTGHLFQGRYFSEAINDDAQLLQTVRYVHLNPTKANGTKPYDWYWSSYSEYAKGVGLCQTGKVLSMTGGLKAFVAYHESGIEELLSRTSSRGRTTKSPSDRKAHRLATIALGEIRADEIKSMETTRRNDCIRGMHAKGLSMRQIERMTGIGRGVIARVLEGER